MIFSSLALAQTSSTLTLTVTTDKPAYYPKENVTMYGNLSQDGTPVLDGLVAIQVEDSTGQLLLIRTATTGTAPSETPYVKVLSIIPCDSSGNPKTSFGRGTIANFNVTLRNNDIEPRQVLITVNTYYRNDTPFCSAGLKSTIDGWTTSSVILPIPIPQDATLGNSTAYGNVYSDWPSLGGWPYSTEKSSTFTITDGTLSSSTFTTSLKQETKFITTQQINGNYNTTFKLLPQAKAGNYTIYVTSRYYGQEASNTTEFEVKLVGDIDRDGDVDYQDDRIFGRAYIAYGQTGQVDPRCDFNEDGKINYEDDRIFGKAYVEYGQTH